MFVVVYHKPSKHTHLLCSMRDDTYTPFATSSRFVVFDGALSIPISPLPARWMACDVCIYNMYMCIWTTDIYIHKTHYVSLPQTSDKQFVSFDAFHTSQCRHIYIRSTWTYTIASPTCIPSIVNMYVDSAL